MPAMSKQLVREWHSGVTTHVGNTIPHRIPNFTTCVCLISMDWFKGKFIGKPHISWENLWFPVDFALNQSIDNYFS